jgi:hypothetical protein
MGIDRRFDSVEPETGTLLLSSEVRNNFQALGRANELRPVLGTAVDPSRPLALFIESGNFATDGSTTRSFTGQLTGDFAPVSGPGLERIDAVVITLAGALTIAQGVEAATGLAVPPPYPADSIPLAEVLIPFGITSLDDPSVVIRDVRPLYVTSAAGFGINPVEETFIATSGQQVFTLTAFQYAPGNFEINVFVGGVRKRITEDYLETGVNEISFLVGLPANETVTVWKVGAASAHTLADLDDVSVAIAEAVTDPDILRPNIADRTNPFATLADVAGSIGGIPFSAEHDSVTGTHGPRVNILQTNDDTALLISRTDPGGTGAAVVITHAGASPGIAHTQSGNGDAISITQNGIGTAINIDYNDTTITNAPLVIDRAVTDPNREPLINLHDDTTGNGMNVSFSDDELTFADEATNTRRFVFDTAVGTLKIQNGGNNVHLFINKTSVGGGRSIDITHSGTAEALNVTSGGTGAAIRVNNTGAGPDFIMATSPAPGGILDPLWDGPTSNADALHTHSFPDTLVDLTDISTAEAAAFNNATGDTGPFGQPNNPADDPSGSNPFATIGDIETGVSLIKFGSYVGNGTSQSIGVGFAPDWLMLYNNDDSTQSGVYAARTGTGRFFNASGAADVTLTGSGFDLNNGTGPINQSTRTYFFIAIKGNQ